MAFESLSEFTKCLEAANITKRGDLLANSSHGLDLVIRLFKSLRTQKRQVWLIGNGGSLSIASHVALDLWNMGQLKAIAIQDPCVLTCMGNDNGFESTFSIPLSRFFRRGDLLVAISSSGRSKNILNAVEAVKKKHGQVVTFSGFDPKNPLRQMGDFNVYVPSKKYGIVESCHFVILHNLADALSKGLNVSNEPRITKRIPATNASHSTH